MSDFVQCKRCFVWFRPEGTAGNVPSHECIVPIDESIGCSTNKGDENMNTIIRLLKQIEYNTRKE